MKKITINSILIYLQWFIFLILLKPGIINQYETINQIFNILMMGITVILFVIYILKGKISNIIVFELLYLVTLFLITFLKEGDIDYFLKIYLPIFGLSIYTDMLINIDVKKFAKGSLYFFASIIIINFFTIIINPHGDVNNRNFFLGYDNNFAPVIVLGCALVLFFSKFLYKRINWKATIVFICTVLSCFITTSAGAKLAAFMLMILYLYMILGKEIKLRKFNHKLFFYISIIMFFVIIIFRMQEYFSFLIEDILDRNLTFSGRTYIWDRCLEYISNSPFIGYGVEDPSVRAITKLIFHAHNIYLNILLEGGLLSLGMYFIFLKKGTEKLNGNNLGCIVGFAISIYYIMTIIEFYVKSQIFFYTIIIAFFINKFVDEDVREDT